MNFIGLFALFLLALPFAAQAEWLEQPQGCLKAHKKPCAVLTTEKTTYRVDHVQIDASANSLIEIQETGLHLLKGLIWIKSKTPIALSNRFGNLTTSQAGEIWAESTESQLWVKAVSNDIEIHPKGQGPGFLLHKGYALALSYFNREVMRSDITRAELILLAPHVKDLSRLALTEEQIRSASSALAKILVAEAPFASERNRLDAERRWASVDEIIKPKVELKPATKAYPRRDSDLLKLFKIKSNFEE